jgi:DNA-binding beta-propeller fold protein YncE
VPPQAQTRGAAAVPTSAELQYAVDPGWPKALPAGWVLGGLGGICIDRQDHVFILNRQDGLDPAELDRGRATPLIIEFDPSGAVVNSWGDPTLLDERLHSCYVDRDSNIWVASSPSGMIQKYSHDGRRLLLQVGKKGAFDSADGTVKGKPLNSDAARFFMPSSIYVEPRSGEVYVADGENPGGNRRVAVFDRDGKFLRQWQPDPTASTVHCMVGTDDALIYVCNRQQGRIQVFDKAASLVKTITVPGGNATAFDFSRDSRQRWMFVINQNDARVEILDRATGAPVTGFGKPGRGPGEFEQPHGIAVDSRGNVFVAENRGRRVQRFSARTGQ